MRTDNQLNYSCFNQLDQETLLGKDGYLYLRSYVWDYLAISQKPEYQFSRLAEKLKMLQDYFAARGVKFLFIIAPNKASIYPEYIPERYQRQKNNNNKTNYELLVPMLESYNVNYLDGHAFFMMLKKNEPYPVFPKGGIHWNYYGAFLFTREITNKISFMIGKKCNELQYDKINLLQEPFEGDGDLALLINLWDWSPFIDPSPYPAMKTGSTPDAFKPNILFIGDSFMYIVLHWFEEYDFLDKRSDFYYYFKQKKIENENKELLSRDVIIIEANESILLDAGFGFIENVLGKSASEYCQEITATLQTITLAIRL